MQAPRSTRRRIGRSAIATLGATLLALGGLAGCNADSPSDTSTTVVYAVVGNVCAADVTYQTLGLQVITVTAQPVPWSFTFDVPAKQVNGFPLSLTATNNCPTGTLTANVVVNDALFGSATTITGNGTVTVAVSLF